MIDYTGLGKRAAACRRVFREVGRTSSGPAMAEAVRAAGTPTQGHAGALLQPSGRKVNMRALFTGNDNEAATDG